MTHDCIRPCRDDSLSLCDLDRGSSKRILAHHPEEDYITKYHAAVTEYNKPRRHLRPTKSMIKCGNNHGKEECKEGKRHCKFLNRSRLSGRTDVHSTFQQFRIVFPNVEC